LGARQLEDNERARDFEVELRLQAGKNAAQISNGALALCTVDIIYPTVLGHRQRDQRHQKKAKDPPSL